MKKKNTHSRHFCSDLSGFYLKRLNAIIWAYRWVFTDFIVLRLLYTDIDENALCGANKPYWGANKASRNKKGRFPTKKFVQ